MKNLSIDVSSKNPNFSHKKSSIFFNFQQKKFLFIELFRLFQTKLIKYSNIFFAMVLQNNVILIMISQRSTPIVVSEQYKCQCPCNLNSKGNVKLCAEFLQSLFSSIFFVDLCWMEMRMESFSPDSFLLF